MKCLPFMLWQIVAPSSENWCGYLFRGQEPMGLMALGKNKNRTSNFFFFFVRSALCFWHSRMSLLVTDKDQIIYINNWVRFWVTFICSHNGTILKEETNVIHGSNSPHLFPKSWWRCFVDSWLLCCCIPKAKDETKVGLLVRVLKSKWVGGDLSHVLPH